MSTTIPLLQSLSQYASSKGHECLFLTLTCPNGFHRFVRRGHAVNPAYTGATPKQAQRWLLDAWARVRTQLQHMKVSVYGLRLIEPHLDGCPHWHVVVWVQDKSSAERAKAHIQHAWQRLTSSKRCCWIRSVSGEVVLGYVRKFVTKAISLPHLAWRSTWGFKTYQVIGNFPQQSTWQEVRAALSNKPAA